MTFLAFAVLGFLVGRKLGAGRGGFVTIGAISIASTELKSISRDTSGERRHLAL